jgi:small subunit ribosomal protein S27e
MDKKIVKSKFLLVKHECGNDQHVFGNVTSEVKCQNCGGVIAKPTGGKAEIIGKVTKVI